MKTLYFDNNATTSLDPAVLSAMQEVLTEIPLNASSAHRLGQEAKQYLIGSRDLLAHALHVKPQEIIFTSGGTEALNFLIRGFHALAPTSHILSSNVEHPAVRLTLADLERLGARVTYLPAGLWGAVRVEELEKSITPSTGLIVLTAVNNVTGVKTDIEAIAAVAEAHKIPFIVDGVQWLGKEAINLPRGVAAIAFSSHKIHGPHGVGAAIVRSHYKLPSLITGGPQEGGRRGGTENLPGIVGFAKAVEMLGTVLPAATAHMETLRDLLIEGLSHSAGNIVVHGQGPHICNTAHIGFPGVDGETLLLQLDLAGAVAAHGSACASGGLEPSPTLLEMGIPVALARSSIRFSLSRLTTEAEVQAVLEIMAMLLKGRGC